MKAERFHMSFSRRFLYDLIRERGPEGIVAGASGEALTTEQALELLQASEREWFVDSECDRVGSDGCCLGHCVNIFDPPEGA